MAKRYFYYCNDCMKRFDRVPIKCLEEGHVVFVELRK